MKNKKLLILMALCSALALSGCDKAPEPVDEDNISIEEPEVDDIETSADDEVVVDVESEVDDPRNPPVGKLPRLEHEEIRTARPRPDRGDYRQSYLFYDGIQDSHYAEYKEILSEVGFSDWTLVEDTEYYIMESSVSGDQEVVLTYFNTEGQEELEVRLIDNSH